MILNIMRRAFIITAAVLAALLFSSCSGNGSEYVPENSIRIFRADLSYSALTWEYYVPKAENQLDIINEVLGVLASKPGNSVYNKVIPDDLQVLNYYFGIDRQLVIDFSEKYNTLDTLSELFCRAGVVKTMCELDFVDGVEFLVNGNPLASAGEIKAGVMTAQDFIDNTGENVRFRQSVDLTVYYADNTGKMMTEAHLIVESNGTRSLEALAMEQLIGGPAFETTELKRSVPEGTELRSITTRDNICYVDLSKEFMDGMDGVGNDIVVYSIVNTLTGLPSINKVHITVEGSPVRSYGLIQLDGFLESRPDLITNERAGDAVE